MNRIKRFKHLYDFRGGRRIVHRVVLRAVRCVLAESELLKCFRICSNVQGLRVRGDGITEKFAKGVSFSEHAGVVIVGDEASAVDVSAFEVMVMRNE